MNIYWGSMIFQLIIFLPILAIFIYLVVLAIKLARRGIIALDIYIEKNKKDNDSY